MAIFLMLGLAGVCAWLGFETRASNKAASNVSFAFAVLFLVLLGVALTT